jgi:hypothetical protein
MIFWMVLMGLPLVVLSLERARTQRSSLIPVDADARPSPPPQEAGTWRGNDIAAAATSVASNTRLAHMFDSSMLFA